MICKICDKEIGSFRSMGLHIRQTHKITSEEYYLKYINPNNKCSVCGSPCKFHNLNLGFSKTCSLKCSTSNSRGKAKDTILKRYGVENAMHLDKFKEKLENTNMKKYGVKNPVQNKDIRDKIKNTNRERLGVDYPTQSVVVRKKIIESNLKNWGVDNVSKNESIKEKVKNTNIERYNVSTPLQQKYVKDKIKQTCMDRYGVDNAFKSEEIRIKNKKEMFKIFYLNIGSRVRKLVSPLFTIDEYTGVSDGKKYGWKCNVCLNDFNDHLDDGHIPRCPICHPLNNVSSSEKEVFQFCRELLDESVQIIENDKLVLNGKELDIYIPSYNLAIEFDGLYWHSELNGKDKNYHLSKTLNCKEKGIQLVHIFEDEWFDKQEIVKSILRNKFKKIKNKIYARKCEVKLIDNETSRDFLVNNHIQGYVGSSLNIGLICDDELVSLLTMGSPRFNKGYEYEILRFCNKINTNVIGGFSKLLKYFITKYKPTNVITYSDLRYGTGDVYSKNGFKFISSTKPSYYYIKENCCKESRIKYQKYKLKDLLETFDPSLTAWQNMQLNGYDRIWDCGCNSFVWK
jgi:hypothetical protein